jgi:hypothetical protein
VRTLHSTGKYVARIIPVLVKQAKEIEGAARRELKALAPVQPDHMTGEAQIDLYGGPVHAIHGEAVHRFGAVRTVHGRHRRHLGSVGLDVSNPLAILKLALAVSIALPPTP